MRHKSTIRKVGIRRGLGGWGDVQMALAVAELYAKEKGGESRPLWSFLKRRDPALAGVTFGCPKELLPLCENVPKVEALACKTDRADKDAPGEDFDNLTFGRRWDITTPCIEYEKALQPNVDRNRTEIWATKLGLKGTPHPTVYLTEAERDWAHMWVIEKGLQGKFLLGVIPHSYSWARDWPAWYKLLWGLRQKAPLLTPIIFMASVDSWDAMEYAVCGIPVFRPGVREHLALMDQCNMVAGVDTGPMHSAVGLGKPTLWVFSHIDGKIRTKGYKKARVVQRTDLECCPCWYESRCHDPHYFAICRSVAVKDVERHILGRYRRWLCFTLFFRMARRLRRPGSAIGTMCPKIAG